MTIRTLQGPKFFFVFQVRRRRIYARKVPSMTVNPSPRVVDGERCYKALLQTGGKGQTIAFSSSPCAATTEKKFAEQFVPIRGLFRIL